MFIGHFGVGLAAKKIAPNINLGFLFIACQLLDLIWPVLVLMGVEQVAVDHSATEVTPLNFLHYPYSHSLVMTLLYSLVGAFVTWRVFKSARVGAVMGFTVFSHWILDLITHRPDLPLLLGDRKVGLGLWNSVWGTLVVEVSIFVIGIFLYIQSSPSMNRKRKMFFWSMIGFLSIVYMGNIFGPKAPEGTPAAAIAGPALAMWLIVVWGYYSDRRV
jgi:membrane-bound metal-dependent hydrolase YbcI (DUF457 family)